jgi:putative flippase GtrA
VGARIEQFGIYINQFIKFGIVGVMNTCVGFGAWLILTKVFGVQYVISNVLSYIPGLLNSYIWNKYWTFKSKGSKKIELVLFVIVFVPCFLVQNAILVFFKEIVRMDVIVSQIISMVFYTVTGYSLNKFITFNKNIVASERTGISARTDINARKKEK